MAKNTSVINKIRIFIVLLIILFCTNFSKAQTKKINFSSPLPLINNGICFLQNFYIYDSIGLVAYQAKDSLLVILDSARTIKVLLQFSQPYQAYKNK
ncbi:MAG: hypothetical protein V4538_16370 [Bacteroidota bacterium]